MFALSAKLVRRHSLSFACFAIAAALAAPLTACTAASGDLPSECAATCDGAQPGELDACGRTCEAASPVAEGKREVVAAGPWRGEALNPRVACGTNTLPDGKGDCIPTPDFLRACKVADRECGDLEGASCGACHGPRACIAGKCVEVTVTKHSGL